MSTRECLTAIRERWIVVAAAGLVGLLVGIGVAAVIPTQYTTSTTLYFAMKGVEGEQFSAYEGNLLAQQRVKSSEALATSERVSDDVIARQNLDLSTDAVERSITATADLDSVLLTISATSTSPQVASRIANGAAGALIRLAAQLDPNSGSAPVTIVPKVVEPAGVPDVPGLAGSGVFLVGGLLAGLIFGAGIAILRSFLDTSIRTVSALEAATGCRALGTTPFDQTVANHPLSVLDPADDALAHAHRRLRIGLESRLSLSAGATVVVTSPSGGEGRTLTTANLAVAFAQAGRTVAVVEADIRSPRLAGYFDLRDGPGLAEVLTGTAQLTDVIQRPMTGLSVVPGGSSVGSNVSAMINSRAMSDVLEQLDAAHDLVLIDAAPVLPLADSLALASWSDAVLLLCRSGRSDSGDARAAAQALAAVSATLLGAILTMVPGKATKVRWAERLRRALRPEPVIKNKIGDPDEDERIVDAGESGGEVPPEGPTPEVEPPVVEPGPVQQQTASPHPRARRGSGSPERPRSAVADGRDRSAS